MMRVKGIRRLVKVYGQPKDPRTIARIKMERRRGRERRGHTGVLTSVRPSIEGDIHS